jgi:hypothetical protein
VNEIKEFKIEKNLFIIIEIKPEEKRDDNEL